MGQTSVESSKHPYTQFGLLGWILPNGRSTQGGCKSKDQIPKRQNGTEKV